ncbi:MAG: homocysteine S-methyltransferase family protein [Chloroflexi bacterium]|nr:homocysteine S-methyltransferase family protein [Chloroflexota bacterium]
MVNYDNLKSRMDQGEVIILDGAVGTELQAMGVPMDPVSWCGPGNYTHAATVRQMHERYIRAGADIITTNTFNTIRPALEASGYGEMVREINARAVDAALEARDRAAGQRPVYIAGSISCRMPVRDRRTGTLLGGTGGYGYGVSISTDELRAYANEQAEILAESGVDLFLIEHMWADNESRVVATEAAKATGLPVWVAFTVSVAPDGQAVRLSMGAARYMGVPMWPSNWRTVDHDMTLVDAIGEIAPLRPDVLGVFHAKIGDTTAALQVMLDQWSGPIVAYPDAGRRDYLETWQDSSVGNEETAEEFTREAASWVGMGAQVIGTCCGFGVDYIKPLRGALPDRISSPRKAA